jgi:hypothetical protein
MDRSIPLSSHFSEYSTFHKGRHTLVEIEQD